ncbi:MAG TPA: zinc ribbon domain-containing protein [Ktedonosporobacter sp.]|nr:zinc ribbon domain-containing protein [Ktedonosporobacter sp.]
MPICPRCHSQLPAQSNFCEHCAQILNEQANGLPTKSIEPWLDEAQDPAIRSFYPPEFIMRADQLPSDKNLIIDAETIPLQSVTPPSSQHGLTPLLRSETGIEPFTTPEMRAARKDFPWIEESLPPFPNGPGLLADALQPASMNGAHQPLLQGAQQTLAMPQQGQIVHGIQQQPTVVHGLHQQAPSIHGAHQQPGIIHAAHHQGGAVTQQGCRWSCLSNSVAMTVTAVVVIVAVIIGSVWFFMRPASTPSTTLVTPTLTISGSVIAGQTIAVNGSHFLAGSSLTVTLDGQPVASKDQDWPHSASEHPQIMALLQPVQAYIPAGGTPVTVAGDGTFSLAVTVPANWSVGSSHTLNVSDANGKNLVSQSFTVQAADQAPGSTPTGSTAATATSRPTTLPPTPTAGTAATPTPTPLLPTPTATPLPAPCITVSPTSIVFNGVVGQGSQAKQTVVISNSCGAGIWSSKADVPWLSMKPGSGSISANGQISVTVSAAVGAAGTLTGNLEFDAGLTANSTIASKVAVPAQLVVAPAPTPTPTATPVPTATPTPLPAGCLQAFPNPILVTSFNPTATVTITNNCGVAGNISSSQPGWLQVTGGSIGAGGSLSVTITGSSLNQRDFGTITFTITTSNGEQQSAQVNVFWRNNQG